MKNLFNESHGHPFVDPNYLGNDDIDPANLVTGTEYIIQVVGDTTWTSLGATEGDRRGERFTATGQAPAGTTGKAIQAHGLYERFQEIVNTNSNNTLSSARYPQYKSQLGSTDTAETNLKYFTGLVAKFSDYYADDSATGDMSREDIWKKPLIVGTVTDVNASSSFATVSGSTEAYVSSPNGGTLGTLFDTTPDHTLPGGAGTTWTAVIPTSFNGTASELNGTTMYATRADDDTFRLAYDSNGDRLYIGRSLESTTVTSTEFDLLGENVKFLTSHTFLDGERVLASGFNNDLAFLNGNHYYVNSDYDGSPNPDGEVVLLYENADLTGQIALDAAPATSGLSWSWVDFTTDNPTDEDIRFTMAGSGIANIDFDHAHFNLNNSYDGLLEPWVDFMADTKDGTDADDKVYLIDQGDNTYKIKYGVATNPITMGYWLDQNFSNAYGTHPKWFDNLTYENLDATHLYPNNDKDGAYKFTWNWDTLAFEPSNTAAEDATFADADMVFPRDYPSQTNLNSTNPWLHTDSSKRSFFLKALSGGKIKFYKDQQLTTPLFPDDQGELAVKIHELVDLNRYNATFSNRIGDTVNIFGGYNSRETQLETDQGDDMLTTASLEGAFTLELGGNPLTDVVYVAVDDGVTHPDAGMQDSQFEPDAPFMTAITGKTYQGRQLYKWTKSGDTNCASTYLDSADAPTPSELVERYTSNDGTEFSVNQADGYYGMYSSRNSKFTQHYALVKSGKVVECFATLDDTRWGTGDTTFLDNLHGAASTPTEITELVLTKNKYSWLPEGVDYGVVSSIAPYAWFHDRVPSGAGTETEIIIPKYYRDTPAGASFIDNGSIRCLQNVGFNYTYPMNTDASSTWLGDPDDDTLNPLWEKSSRGMNIRMGTNDLTADSRVAESSYTFTYADGTGSTHTRSITAEKLTLSGSYDSADIGLNTSGVTWYYETDAMLTPYNDSLTNKYRPEINQLGAIPLMRPGRDVLLGNEQLGGDYWINRFPDSTDAIHVTSVVNVYTHATTGTLSNEKPATWTETTTGTIQSDQADYQLTSINLMHHGNTKYSYQDTNNDEAYGAQVISKFWKPWNATAHYNQTLPDITVNVGTSGSGSGYLTSVVLNADHDSAQYTEAGEILLEIEALDDTFVPTPADLIETEETFTTTTPWTDTGDAEKVWPYAVWPASATISVEQPSSVTQSISGIKYVRNSGFMRWGMEVTYPPMTGDQFREFWSASQKARGQTIPFKFKLRDGDKRIFNYNPDINATAIVKEATAIGDSVIHLEGFGNTDTLKDGQLIRLQNRNGYINTIIADVDANVYGEVKIMLAYPMDYALSKGTVLETDPDHCVVTLADNGFEYQRDTNGFYYVSVKFDFDEWK